MTTDVLRELHHESDGCREYDAELLEQALTGACAPEIEAHVASCSRCEAALRRYRVTEQSLHGAFLGAIFLITMPQVIALAKDFLPAAVGQAPGLQGLVYGLVLIAFVLFEPMGLYGRWLKVRTYFQVFPFYRKGLFKRQKSFQKSERLR